MCASGIVVGTASDIWETRRPGAAVGCRGRRKGRGGIVPPPELPRDGAGGEGTRAPDSDGKGFAVDIYTSPPSYRPGKPQIGKQRCKAPVLSPGGQLRRAPAAHSDKSRASYATKGWEMSETPILRRRRGGRAPLRDGKRIPERTRQSSRAGRPRAGWKGRVLRGDGEFPHIDASLSVAKWDSGSHLAFAATAKREGR